MKTNLRIFWLVSLLIFTAGCSGFRSACFTRSDESPAIDSAGWEACGLRPGEKVRVTTASGNRVVGRVDRVTQGWITLQTDNDLDPPILFTPAEIISIEKALTRSREPETVDHVEIGEDICLNLTDGSRVNGEVASVNSEKIILIHKGASSQVREYPVSRVRSMEREKKGPSSTTPVFIVLGLVLVAGVVVLASEMSELNNIMSD